MRTDMLTQGRERWLRDAIPEFAELRDKMIAAGLIDPALPVTAEMAGQIQKIEGVLAPFTTKQKA